MQKSVKRANMQTYDEIYKTFGSGRRSQTSWFSKGRFYDYDRILQRYKNYSNHSTL